MMNGKFFWILGGLVVTVVVLNIAGPVVRGGASQPADAAAQGPVTAAFQVQGMTCKACELPVRRALAALPGVQRVAVSYQQGSALVTYDPAKLRPEQITAAIGKSGYRARQEATACGRR
ncbi:MAG TPA: heavy metal-associated domain-containing protein [Thermoanaerobaculia bacterium]